MLNVAGFTVAHDVSARDWQLKKNGGQWLLGKAIDGFCPLGPCIVTKDEIGDPHALRLKTTLNGVVVQVIVTLKTSIHTGNTNRRASLPLRRTVIRKSWCTKRRTSLRGSPSS